MSNELIGILIASAAVGVALIGVILTSNRGLRQDMAQVRHDMTQMEGRLREDMSRLRQDIKQGEARIEAQINGVRGEVNELRERMSHLEGLLEGLREVVTGRVAAR